MGRRRSPRAAGAVPSPRAEGAPRDDDLVPDVGTPRLALPEGDRGPSSGTNGFAVASPGAPPESGPEAAWNWRAWDSLETSPRTSSRNKISSAASSGALAAPTLAGFYAGSIREIAEEVRVVVREEIRAALADRASAAFAPPTTSPIRKAAAEAVAAPAAEGAAARGPAESTSASAAARDGTESTRTLGHSMSRREAIRQMEAEAEAQIEDYTKVLEEDETKEVYDFMVRVCPCRCGHRTTMRLLYCYSLLGKLEAPPRTDPISRLVDSQLFSFATAMLMLANCWFMARVADDDMEAYSSGSEPSGEFQRIGEQIFLGLYSVEFLFKFWRQRSYFWVDSNWKYNWLDVGLISISLYFMVLSDVLAGVSWLRILRVCKLAKLLRVVKLASTFKVLRNMLTSLINSVGTLAWSMVLLLMILFLFALTFVQRTAAFLSTEAATLDEAELTALVELFGGVGVTLRNLYMCMTGGNDWSVYYEPLAPTGVLNQLIFLLFVAFTQIALLNIILGVFVDKAMKNMSVGPQELALEHLEMEREQEQNLYDLCNHADQNGDGIMNLQEWRRALNKGDLTGYLQMIGIRPENMIELFKVLQNDSGEVNVNRFVRGCICMKGNASSFDVHLVLQDIKDLLRLSDERHEELQQALAKLGAF